MFCFLFSCIFAVTPPRDSPFKKVVIVVFENADDDVVFALPTFNLVAQAGAYLSEFHAVARPSQPNYIAMTSGDFYGIDNNDPLALTETNIVDLLEGAGYSWKAYAENFPGECFLEDDTENNYMRKHNPFVNYANIVSDTERCGRIVNGTNFYNDIQNEDLPDFSFYIPNLVHNGHNNGPTDSDDWLGGYLLPLMENPYVLESGVLFVLTYDESDPNGTPEDFAANKIYTSLYGTMVNSIVLEESYNFYNLIRTIQDAWELESFGRNDATASAIDPVVWSV